MRILSSQKHKAVKYHKCDGFKQICELENDKEFSKNLKCKGVINIKQCYFVQNVVEDGFFYSFKCCEECYKIIMNNSLFYDD